MMLETCLSVYNGKAPPWSCTDWYGGFGIEGTVEPINAWGLASVYGISASQPNGDPVVPGILPSWAFPGSMHVGGMHVVLADGSVRFISQNINFTTQKNLVYIADGTPLGDF
jgi:hypothetical protein